MSEALNLLHDTLDVFSGKKPAMKEERPGLVDVMNAARTREKAKCRTDCRFPSWAGGCPYLFVNGESCEYYGMKMAEATMENGIIDREWVAKKLRYYQDAEEAAVERIKTAEAALAKAKADLVSAQEALAGARGGIAGFTWQMEQLEENGLHNSP